APKALVERVGSEEAFARGEARARARLYLTSSRILVHYSKENRAMSDMFESSEMSLSPRGGRDDDDLDDEPLDDDVEDEDDLDNEVDFDYEDDFDDDEDDDDLDEDDEDDEDEDEDDLDEDDLDEEDDEFD